MSTKHPEIGKGIEDAAIRNNENEAIDSPTPRNNEAKTPHCNMYNLVMELRTVRAQKRVCTCGTPVAIGLEKHGRAIAHLFALASSAGLASQLQPQEPYKMRTARRRLCCAGMLFLVSRSLAHTSLFWSLNTSPKKGPPL